MSMAFKHIIYVATNVAHYDDPNEPTGLWLSELTHVGLTVGARKISGNPRAPGGAARIFASAILTGVSHDSGR